MSDCDNNDNEATTASSLGGMRARAREGRGEGNDVLAALSRLGQDEGERHQSNGCIVNGR